MADQSLIDLPIGMFLGDTNAQLVAGDLRAIPINLNDCPAFEFDDTDEMAIVSQRFRFPTQYAAGVLKAEIGFFMASDVTNDVALDIFVEAVTPGVDTIDLETATGWDTANSGTLSLSGTTAGDPLVLTVTLTNKDGLAAGDFVRLGVRRDTDSANDDAVGKLFITAFHILETL